jgi:nucleoside transporter
MNLGMRARLSTMMFMEYFIWGAWYVTLGTWLAQSLHFSGQQIGFAAGTTAIGAIISPFFVGLIADKLFTTQKVLAVLHFLGAVLLFAGSRQFHFVSVYVFILLYCLCFMPTLALTNSLAFRHMDDPKKEFGPIRVPGTGGWIVAGLLIGTLHLEASDIPMKLAATASMLMAAYCLTLPDTPPLSRSTSLTVGGLFPKEAVHLLKERSMAIFAIASFLICIPLQFYYAFTNLFLNQIGVANAAGKMTGGQMSELFCMLLIPWFFRRLGVKYMLVAGMVAWTLRYILFAYGFVGSHMWMLWGGILLHGISYDFFFVTGQIYIDRKASSELRAAAQGLITFITYGLGMFVGSWLSGYVVDYYARTGPGGFVAHNWRAIWLFSAISSAVVLLLFLFTFRNQETAEDVKVPAEGIAATEAVV